MCWFITVILLHHTCTSSITLTSLILLISDIKFLIPKLTYIYTAVGKVAWLEIQGEADKVLQSDSTQTIDHTQKFLRQKFQCSRRPSYWTNLFFYRWRRWSYVKVNSTFLNGTMYFFLMTLLPILRRIQQPTTQSHSSHAKYENSRKIFFISFHFLRYSW